MKLERYLEGRRLDVEAAFDKLLPGKKVLPSTIHEAMRYSIFVGGKRLRPILCLAAAEACGGSRNKALPLACAVECIHTYSLIHDDLPCMDDDDMRRGQPTCHKVYGEAVGVLTGDALQALAFEIAAGSRGSRRYPVGALVRELAVAAGSQRLIAGQVLDLEGERKKLGKAQLVRIHKNKTAALIAASIRLGAMSADAGPKALERLTDFGEALGLAFQVIDDILDVTRTSQQLGKSAGKDLKAGKTTYPSVLGLEKSRAEAGRLTRKAHRALEGFGKDGARLREIAVYLLERDY